MALRKVFSQDSDFQERMFAKQIAVMKGQAWNVVETLKTRDHGPLELTRRARVCVWDDLVDVPVAIPMRVPSAEMRRRRESELRRDLEEEEMDISAANAGSAPAPKHDLLDINSPIGDLPNPNRFDLSRNASASDLGHSLDGSNETIATAAGATSELDPGSNRSIGSRPTPPRQRVSFETAHGRSPGYTNNPRRRYSFSTRHGHSSSTGFLGSGDDIEGDLGYAAAEGMEGSQRKVIVERLETVKSKHPVFTCC